MGSVSFLTAKLPVIGFKLYLLLSIATAVLLTAGAILAILFLRSRRTRQHSVRVDHLSSGLITKEIGEIEVAENRAAEAKKEGGGGGGDRTAGEECGGGDGTAEGRSVRARNPAEEKSMGNIGWGLWYTLRELEEATAGFSEENVIGKGGYGIVYRGVLPDHSTVAVKNLLNNKGQAEKEFKIEVEAIGKVRHKNLVGLVGYCVEGPKRMLVYEYIENGNLEQWLHGDVGPISPLTWDIRMKIAIGTAKGLAYLHEGLEPKVVHRDIKSSNILLDKQWNPKVSDFGLAKLLGPGSSFVTTRVMGTFGYVAPDYACTGMLNEASDIYSFGVLLMELITGRSPVDHSRPPGEVNLVDWFKGMVGSKHGEDVVDRLIDVQPSPRALKRVLLVCLRCIDSDAYNRPKMGQVAHMLEGDDFPFRAEHRSPQEASLAPASPLTARRSPLHLPPKKEVTGDSQRAAMWR